MSEKSNNSNSSEDKINLQGLLYSRTFWNVYSTTILIAAGLIAWLYNLGKDNGQSNCNNEKYALQKENDKLKSDTTNLKLIIYNLQNCTAQYIATINTLRNIDGTKEQPKEKHSDKSKKKIETPKSTKKKKEDTETKPTKVNTDKDEKTAELQMQLDYYVEQNKNLLDENDKLKGDVSIMQQQLNRAREFEQKIKLETDNFKKSILAKQRDELLAKVENKMKELVPDNRQKSPIKPDTVTVTVIQTVTDYEKLGDDNFNTANDYETKLKTQPDKYFIGLISNKTKTDFIQLVLTSYKSALENYKLANKEEKIKTTEKKITDFKKAFGLH